MTRTAAVLAAWGLLVAAVLGLPVSAYAEAAPSTLALTAPASARITSPVTLTATLSTPAGPLSGRSVTYESLTSTGWTTLGTATTDGSGVATFATTVAASSNTYRAEYAGDADSQPATSAEAQVTGTPYPTTLAIGGKRKVVDEQTTYVTATWRTDTGRAVPGTVSLYARPRGGAWSRVAVVALGTDGYAAIGVRPRVDTSYQLRGPAGPWWSAAASPVLAVDNVPPGRPVVLPKAAPKGPGLPQQVRAVGAGANIVATTIADPMWAQMDGITWHRGCPVGRSGLRLLRINYWGYDGYRHRGELVVNVHAVAQFRSAFTALYAHRIPIRSMYRVDRFGYNRTSGGGNDYASMRHDNTSAFNCRWVSGNPGVRSPHSYGYSLDINTWENPYRSRWGYLPDSWWMHHANPRYAWRSRSAVVVRLMRSHGFSWTYGLGDTQHFDARHSGARTIDTTWRKRGYVDD